MSWWHRLWRKKQLDAQLDKELDFHLEQHIADLIQEGYDPQEARRRARLELGGPEQVKESTRDARGTRWLEDFGRDVRYSFRTLRHKLGFSAVTLLTLALGIGATTIMFTVVDGVLLKPLPFPEPERLVVLQEQTEQATQYGDLWAFAYPNFLDVQRESRTLSTAASRFRDGTVSNPGEAEYVSGREVSSNFLGVLGVSLLEGRGFLPEEDSPGAAPVAIIGYDLWQRQFGGATSALGKHLVFDGAPYMVVGVLPPDFRWRGEPGVLLPIGQNATPPMKNRQAHPGITVVARLQPEVTIEEGRSELTRIGRQLAEAYPASNEGRTFIADPLRPDVGDARSTLWLLLGAVSLVLLIACVNVACLLLARAVSREQELAMRVALGARRGRLIRQCLTESAVLGLAGGTVGVLFGIAGLRPFMAFWPGGLPRAEFVQVDWRMLLFALGVSMIVGLLFGLVPALAVPTRGFDQALRAGSRATAGNSRKAHSAFVISEIALTVVLLVSAGMLGRTLLRLSALDPGIRIDHLLVTRMALSPATLKDPGRIRAEWNDVLERAQRVPGVEAIAMLDTVPMRPGNNRLAFWPSANLPPQDKLPLALATSVTPGYLKVMGVGLLQGRFFDDRDRLDAEPTVVIDEVLAQQAFGNNDPIGKPLWVPDAGRRPLRVVGVVRHVRHWGLAEDDQAQVRAQLYYPFAQVPDPLLRRWSELMSIAVRTSVEPTGVVGPLQRELRGAGGDQVLYEVRTMDQLAEGSLSQQRFLLLLFAVFAGLALLLTSVGIYGVLTYITSQRVREIGLRIALGASAKGVIGMVLGQSLRLVVVGAGLGIVAALGAEQLLERFVAGMQKGQSWTFVLMVSVLIAAALLASYLPALRASRVDPMNALRRD
jgi:predicted permease